MLATIMMTVGSIVMVLVALLLIGLILLQKNRGSGLSGAFGGVGGHTAFGTKTGDFLTWVTVGLTAVFLLMAILLNFEFRPTPIAETTGTPAASTALPATTERPPPVVIPTEPVRAPIAPPAPTGN